MREREEPGGGGGERVCEEHGCQVAGAQQAGNIRYWPNVQFKLSISRKGCQHSLLTAHKRDDITIINQRCKFIEKEFKVLQPQPHGPHLVMCLPKNVYW